MCVQIANDSELIDSTKLCVGAIIQPLANPGRDEVRPLITPVFYAAYSYSAFVAYRCMCFAFAVAVAQEPVAVVDYPEGPLRCTRCKAYVNPFFTFIEGGAKFVCNICEMKNEGN